MKENIDWQMLKSEYTEGTLTLTALAEKYNLSYYVLVRRAGMERWREARQRFRNPESVRKDYSVGDIADQLNRKLQQWVEDPDSVNIADIDKAAGVLKKLQDMKRSDQEEAPVIYLSHQIPRHEGDNPLHPDSRTESMG